MVDEGQKEIIQRWNAEAHAMVNDIARDYPNIPVSDPNFQAYFDQETYYRNLEQSILFEYRSGGTWKPLAVFNPPSEKAFSQRVNPQLLEFVRRGARPYISRTPDLLWLVAPMPNKPDLFLYVGTSVNAGFINRQHRAADDVLREFAALQKRARSLQLGFNFLLFAVALLIVAVTVWIALAVADRIVRPVNDLVRAARHVTAGDLTTRVQALESGDEVAALGSAFNQMTERLQEQTDELVSANRQLDNRRALIEAVMSGVSAGVIAVARDRTIRLINESAGAMLRMVEGSPVGRPLADVAPELDAFLNENTGEGIVQLVTGGETRTLAVTATGDELGQVLTFDDITQQLLDQRRAAWSDVARRIAHEIKNPLTPIQLAAERLQRRYGKQIDPADTTFARLTDTIVRQVADLRRMVDEFSSFARMPKPVFREESLLDLVRQAVFLHEVAHPNIAFLLGHPDFTPNLVCDRRQIGQALTNVVKNAVEAIEARDEGAPRGEIATTIHADHDRLIVEIADNGIGLPPERNRIVEPYMTTRSRGTGLGLAIVKKIVEEHFGTIAFADHPGGGTIVTLCFEPALLASFAAQAAEGDTVEDSLSQLTRTGNKA